MELTPSLLLPCAGPALANRRPCSNFSPLHFFSLIAPLPLCLPLSFLPICLPFLSPFLRPFPFLSFSSHPCHKATLLNQPGDLGERCKLPQWGPGRSPGRSRILLYCMLRKRIWLQRFWFFGQHCNEWQSKSQSRLWSNLESLCNLRHNLNH